MTPLRLVPSPLELRAARRELPRIDWWRLAAALVIGFDLAIALGAWVAR